MCGIVGVVASRDAAAWRPAVDRGVKTLAHRGPDDDGVEVVSAAADHGSGAGAVLGNTRLAIQDLSPAGHMPMASPGRDVWITYNGELFNVHEVRGELTALGHRFVSTGDTEVLLHAYLQWGDGFLPRLNGMFALAIADVRGGRLRCLLARDQLGVKPCYYAVRSGTLAFASEIKGLFALGLVSSEIDWQSVWDYFSYLYVPGPATMYRGVCQLPPAHALVWEADGAWSMHRYWNPVSSASRVAPSVSLAEAVGELRTLLSDAVRRQLIGDVPLGVFLSGGIDSTILAALAAQAGAKPVKTFTVLFQGEGIEAVDDRLYARRVGARYGTEHHELVVDVEPDALLEMVRIFDQPFGNPTFYLSHLISSLTREHVTVALSGAGGDELFGGYPRYRALPYAGLLAGLPAVTGRALAAGLTWLLPEDPGDPWPRRLKLLLRGVGHPLAEQYLRWTYYLADEDKARLLAPAACMVDRRPSARLLARRLADAAMLEDLGTRIQYVDLETFLADNILEYTDRTSMAVSLEVRVPFLDPRVVEWSFRRRFSDKLGGGVSKKILRAAFGDLFPSENLSAPKRGFCPPLAVWMRRLDRYFDEHMGPGYVARQGIFDWAAIEALRHAHRARRRDHSMELFGIIMFDVWWRRYVEGER